MKYILFSICVVSSLKMFSQPNYIYIKAESNEKNNHCICQLYLSADRDLMSDTIQIFRSFFHSVRCGRSQLIGITIDCLQPGISRTFPVNFSCGDSVVVNVASGTWRVLNNRINLPKLYSCQIINYEN